MLVHHAHEILVERSGALAACSLWVLLRGYDVDMACEADLHMIVDATRASGECLRFSMLIESLGSHYEIRQDISAAVFAHADALPPGLPVLAEHFASGALFVWKGGTLRIPPQQAAAIFKEALSWCADDYSDLLAEFRDLLEQGRG